MSSGDDSILSSSESQLQSSGGIEPASSDLLSSVSKRRDVVIAALGDDIERHLNLLCAEGSCFAGTDIILLRQNPSKAVVLEEYLHGVQHSIGIQNRLGENYAEWHVNDFMIRQRSLLGLGDEDVARLEANRAHYGAIPEVQAHIENETLRKQEARVLTGPEISGGVEHRAAHGVGVASAVVNATEGNYGAAALDTAGVVAETKLGERVLDGAVDVLRHISPRQVFNGLAQGAKRAPLLGAAVTAGVVLYSSGAQAAAGNYDLAAAELVAGTAEAAGNIVGFGAGDAAREATRQAMIAAGGDRFEQVDKSGIRQLGEGAYALGEKAYESLTAPTGQPVADVLLPNHASMAQGADGMGDRSEVSRIAIERTGLAANDPRNNMGLLSQEANRPTAHLLVLEDGSVQGPESGAVPFGNNPQIAAGKNGGTLGILYAGTGAMNDAQWNTVSQVKDWLSQQRTADGLSGPAELIAGSTTTAEILNLPTPRGPLPQAVAPQPGMAPARPRQMLAAGAGGMSS